MTHKQQHVLPSSSQHGHGLLHCKQFAHLIMCENIQVIVLNNPNTKHVLSKTVLTKKKTLKKILQPYKTANNKQSSDGFLT